MRPRFILVLAVQLIACAFGFAQQCQPHLVPGPFTSINGNVDVAISFADGRGGQAVYLGGSFSLVNGVQTSPILRWWPATGEWESLGGFSSAQGGVRDLVVFDDGTGPTLYAGLWRDGVWRWNGTIWSQLGLVPGYPLVDLAVVDLGSGPRLVAAFVDQGPIAAWTGSAWVPVESPTSRLHFGFVKRVVPAPPGETTYSFYVLGTGIDRTNPSMPSGFTRMERHIGWDGQSWSNAASPDGLLPAVFYPDTVVFDHHDGLGPQLHIIEGSFVVWRFDTATRRWTTLPNGPDGVRPQGYTIAAFDDGHGLQLFCDTWWGLARYDSGRWIAVVPNAFVSTSPSRIVIDSLVPYAPAPHSRPVLIITGHYQIAGTGYFGVSYLTSCAPCPADFDSSGALGVQDVLSYLQAWFGGSPGAEFDDTPGVTLDDLFAFLAAWQTGCL